MHSHSHGEIDTLSHHSHPIPNIHSQASNLAFALRANFSKSAMTLFKDGKKGNRNMTPANVYGVVTIMAFLLAAPLVRTLCVCCCFCLGFPPADGEVETIFSPHVFHHPPRITNQALLWEGVDLQPSWRVATEKVEPRALALNVALSGLFHYLNNEVMYLALDNVHPITLAVGNTAKRVFIIVASLVRACVPACVSPSGTYRTGHLTLSSPPHPFLSLTHNNNDNTVNDTTTHAQLVFRNPITTTGAMGSAVGIGGVLLYSLVKQHYDSQK